ncbi:formylglycine-generating enzyme family protein [Rhodohalobacter sulfatireducens]|uniref:Formylglycine-generating enzyme family protein n=1 Tax=Rhodohalobacter sulfatireducens TaxID=2911366 RepID=A0ABS9KH32_9BACT|nr:SUMF1/EgtB/PvdO family nonheme iron enzyme [Rhodohalobacter sulfatireducens]MCG2590135.1 formylglycine-generating enzyme family protein [Rhodohalobacter sulfatireducens]MDR9366707.1 SUMF1/EgtB/PvdO family nonheme iron enzyme [Balneolaceae bacterium]MDR9409995.1 SUMF1/EgtB/PvdO family nonheme iron enzyme [Balneolaceae bacterium]
MKSFKFVRKLPNLSILLLYMVLPFFLFSCKGTEVQTVSTPDQPTEQEQSVSEPESSTEISEYSADIPGSDEEIEMVLVPGGTYSMGPFQDSGTYEVKVDSFWIGKYEITWDEYNLFRNEMLEEIRSQVYKNLYGVDIDSDAVSSPTLTEEALDLLRDNDIPADIISLPSPPYSDITAGMGTNGFPAVSMTHYSAFMFTKWLTVKTGDFYRLPTEAEWEYACRAANSNSYEPIKNQAELNEYAWYRGNSNRKYHQPGAKEPNALGIYDMLGNVAEWTFDQYHEDYASTLEHNPADNPYFKPTELYPRAVRGGSWMDSAEAVSCLQRRGSDPSWKMRDPQLPKSLWWHTNAPFVGLRVVRPVNEPGSVDEMEEYWIEAIQDYN